MAITNNISRSAFLRNLGSTALQHSGPRFWLDPELAQAANATISRDPLVVIFLRGGCDGLNFVSPLSGDDRKIYEQERPNLKHPLSGDEALLPLDSRFGFHPKAKGLHQLYTEKKLAIFTATGLVTNTRSHFDAQNFIDLGTPGVKNTNSGWLTRFLQLKGSVAGEVPGVAIGALQPTSLLNYEKAFSVADLRRLNLGGKKNLQDEQQAILEALYQEGNSWAHQSGAEALSSLRVLQTGLAKATAEKTSPYPKSDLGNRLQILAQMFDLPLALRVAAVDFGGWDTHKYQGAGANGTFANQVSQLSEAVTAFFADLQTRANGKNATILVFSEFGRRLRENANRGTDHGHGGIFFVLGNGVQGGKVLGKWNSLKTEALYERADIPVLTDYREIIAEILLDKYKLGKPALEAVFPNFHKKLHFGLVHKTV